MSVLAMEKRVGKVPIATIALGWPNERPAARTRYREEAVHGV